jgi:hypothetical protein
MVKRKKRKETKKTLADEISQTKKIQLITITVLISTLLFTALAFYLNYLTAIPYVYGPVFKCPEHINDIQTFEYKLGNYGKMPTQTIYTTYGENILGRSLYHSQGEPFKKESSGSFPLPPISLNDNEQTSVKFQVKIENSSLSKASFSLVFHYGEPLVPYKISWGPYKCIYEKNNSNVENNTEYILVDEYFDRFSALRYEFWFPFAYLTIFAIVFTILYLLRRRLF